MRLRLQIALRLGRTLGEYLDDVTECEHEIIREHLADEWNRPNRSDHYLMQIASMLSTNRNLDAFEIKFSHGDPEQPPADVLLGIAPEVEVRISRAEAAEIAKLPAGEAAARRRQLANQRGERK